MHSRTQSFFYHMKKENNRMAPMCSHVQHCTAITCQAGLRQPIRVKNKVVP